MIITNNSALLVFPYEIFDSISKFFDAILNQQGLGIIVTLDLLAFFHHDFITTAMFKGSIFILKMFSELSAYCHLNSQYHHFIM